MKNKKYYNEFLKLYEEAYKLGVTDLFHKVYKLAYNKGYDDALKRFMTKTK